MAASGSPAYARALVQRLSSSSSNQQAEAAAKLAALGRHAIAAEAAVGAGAIPALLQLFTRSSSTVSSQAVCALSSLCSFNSARLRQLVQAGGVEALLPLLAGAPDVSKTYRRLQRSSSPAWPRHCLKPSSSWGQPSWNPSCHCCEPLGAIPRVPQL